MSAQQGWECPRCGKVYAPWMPSCTSCSAAVVVSGGTCAHQWISDTFGTRCMICGQVSGTEVVRYTTGTPPVAKPDNTCEAP